MTEILWAIISVALAVLLLPVAVAGVFVVIDLAVMIGLILSGLIHRLLGVGDAIVHGILGWFSFLDPAVEKILDWVERSPRR